DVAASGEGTVVVDVFFLNRGTAFGESNVKAALARRGVTLEPVRCPAKADSAAQTTYYRLTGTNTKPAFLLTRTMCGTTACDVYGLRLEDQLPDMTPQQRGLYKDQCTAASR